MAMIYCHLDLKKMNYFIFIEPWVWPQSIKSERYSEIPKIESGLCVKTIRGILLGTFLKACSGFKIHLFLYNKKL